MLKAAEAYVSDLFAKDAGDKLTYHNHAHNKAVMDRVNEIAAHYDMPDEDVLALNIAAVFHDTGHMYTSPMEHEAKSAEIAAEWLEKFGASESTRDMVTKLILATKLDKQPESLAEQVIKDADTYNLGTKAFKENDALLKEEMQNRKYTTLLAGWEENTVNLLENHEFFTDYCKDQLNKRKKKNLAKLRKKMDKVNHKNAGTAFLATPIGVDGEKAEKPSSFVTKGIQTMLRLTSENHIALSEMADSKANILISVNAIVISLILSILIRKIQVDTYLTIPTMMFLATSVITIVLAILATRPKITQGRFSREDIVHGSTNLLFFGNFYKSSLDDYKWAMSMLMRDPNYLYGALVDDIYYLGVVLGRKYNLLSRAYSIFMIGLVLSVIAFTIAFATHNPESGTVIERIEGSPF